ncbi:MAG: metallophosphoesterase [Haloarculaceae archaeon]
MGVEPVPGAPAAVADVGAGGPALVVADYHAGLEQSLRRDGVELRDRAAERREALLSLLDRTGATRLIVLGDLATAIGEPSGDERTELESLLDALPVPVTLAKGNHDGEIETVLDRFPDATVTPAHGTRLGNVGFAHGHTWPAPTVIEAPTVCVAHEHPMVRLEDEVGGTRAERVWLRGRLDPAPFEDHAGQDCAVDGDLVVFPAFNDLTGGTWVNVREQGFLAPFLPAGLADGEAYLLDGTRLGDYRTV